LFSSREFVALANTVSTFVSIADPPFADHLDLLKLDTHREFLSNLPHFSVSCKALTFCET
jgi:hypothetical protein